MDQREKELLEKYKETDADLRALWEEHVLYSSQVDKLEAKSYRTPIEEQNLQQLKKQKLEVKTKMMEFLDKIKRQEQ